MEISFSQSFLDNLERIDNKVVIDKLVIDQENQDRFSSYQSWKRCSDMC